ncbi:MAG TPA: hypothetical protein VFP46_02470 [Candidatus Paceibacterota bacterium]|nr:hypothetical protein [Candidatus Paceibacterota bacterium]
MTLSDIQFGRNCGHAQEYLLSPQPLVIGDYEYNFYLYDNRWVRAYRSLKVGLEVHEERVPFVMLSYDLQAVFLRWAGKEKPEELLWEPGRTLQTA